VDGTGKIQAITQDGIAKRFTITVSDKLTSSMIEKGSVAVDGISLTLYKVTKNAFEISLIPHTQDVTTLMLKKVGDTVNIETDMIGKYIEKMLQSKENLSHDDLRKWGY
jgi:riboflavin synthase